MPRIPFRFCPRLLQCAKRLEEPFLITVELIPDPDEGGFTARLPDLPAYGEGTTEEEAIADLREAVRGYIETFGRDDAVNRISNPISLRQLDWDLTELAHG
jgi:predicted RNase H-like HicB family nuclease